MLTVSAPKNKNYCAIVVELKTFAQLPNCDNVKAALIFGNSVIVSTAVQPGEKGLFFPVETALSKGFAGNNNLFRKPEFGNTDKSKTGYFEEHGRVKCVKFRGHKSEGFWIPLSSLEYLGVDISELRVGDEFDTLGGQEICRKYVAKSHFRGQRTHKAVTKRDLFANGQFRFHTDTENLRRNMSKISPDDLISISDKWHGTSAVFANVLVPRELKWYERLLLKLGVQIKREEYALVWSSRRVIKGIRDKSVCGQQHYYSSDIWGTVAKEIEHTIPVGFTIYGEIVGYTTTGESIQKAYSYGCSPSEHKFLVYRVTVTTPEGTVTELGWQQVKEFCEKRGLETVRELFFGKARDLWEGRPDETVEEWRESFLKRLELNFVSDRKCKYNSFKVPAEGVVLRKDHLDRAEVYKCKNFAFLERETKMLDLGEQDMETSESEA